MWLRRSADIRLICQNNQNQETEEKKGLVDNIKDKIEEVKKLWDESDEKTNDEK